MKFSTKEKPPIIFLHGYLADKRIFYKNTEYLKNYFTVYSFDFKGFGENKGMDYPYSLWDYVNQLKDFIKDNNIVRPNIIAHSFGGRVAILSAAENPTLLNKIVLTGAAGVRPKFSLFKWAKKTLFKFLKRFIKKEKLIKFYSKDYQKLSPVMRESFNKIVNFHLDGYLEKITNETLIIVGKKDRETPPYMARRMKKKIKNSKLKILSKSGHFAFIDETYLFNTTVKEFLK